MSLTKPSYKQTILHIVAILNVLSVFRELAVTVHI